MYNHTLHSLEAPNSDRRVRGAELALDAIYTEVGAEGFLEEVLLLLKIFLVGGAGGGAVDVEGRKLELSLLAERLLAQAWGLSTLRVTVNSKSGAGEMVRCEKRHGNKKISAGPQN